jgi:geranylgeranyl diphosphate synthase, type II
MGPAASQTEAIAREWLARDGKRWRPFLAVCAFQAMTENPDAPLPSELRKVAAAVECFHKASLIHDDIEDGDAERYGRPALHVEIGVPAALNVGDFLVGEGYRLLATVDAPAEIRIAMARAAAEGHRTLCLGQGAELLWARDPQPMKADQVLGIFSQKTAPAFEVALQLGILFSGSSIDVSSTLAKYSRALGIAYQIRDDLDDLSASGISDLAALRPTLPLALAMERAKGPSREIVERFWRRISSADDAVQLPRILVETKAEDRCRGLFEAYKEEAVRALREIEHPSLKGLLRRVLGKIFSVEIKGWCSEFEARNAAGSPAGAETTR